MMFKKSRNSKVDIRNPRSLSCRRLLGAGAAVAAVLLSPLHVFAQGCPLCYQAVASARADVIRAIQNGIIVLAIPPLVIVIGIIYAAYKRRESFHEDEPPGPGFIPDAMLPEPDGSESEPREDASVLEAKVR